MISILLTFISLDFHVWLIAFLPASNDFFFFFKLNTVIGTAFSHYNRNKLQSGFTAWPQQGFKGNHLLRNSKLQQLRSFRFTGFELDEIRKPAEEKFTWLNKH